LNYNSNFTIATSVDDGVASAITGTKNMTGTATVSTPLPIIPGPVDTGDEPPIDLTDEPESEEDSVDDTVTETLDDGITNEDGQFEGQTASQDTQTFTSARAKTARPEATAAKSASTQATEYNDDFMATIIEDFNVDYHTLSYTISGVMDYAAEEITNITADLYSSIEMLSHSFDSMERHEKIVTKTVVGGTLALSAGTAIWVLRGGSLVASMLSTMPMWKGFDPLPVLSLSRQERLKKIKEARAAEEEESRKNKKVLDVFDANNAQHEKNDGEDGMS
ncbi:MAG: hypothetical protein AMK71_08245, partial [Nitrospira bacterium SG8_35_4]